MDISAISGVGVGYMPSIGRSQFSSSSVAANNQTPAEYPADIVNINGEEQEDELAIYTRDDILEKDQDDSGQELTDSEREMVQDLAARDQEVRSHEEAHAALLGQYAIGGPTYTYQIGPDGKSYAVGGSITANTGSEATPEATIAKAQIIEQAAGGVDDPSIADASAMAGAYQMAAEASISMMA